MGRPRAATAAFVQLISDNTATLDRALGKSGQPYTKRTFHGAFNEARRDAAGPLGFEIVDTTPQTTEKYRKMYLGVVRKSPETQTTGRLESLLNCRNVASLAAGFPCMVGARYDEQGLIVGYDIPPDLWANIDMTSFGLSAKDGEIQDFVLSTADALTLGEMGYSIKSTVDAEWLWAGVKVAATTTARGLSLPPVVMIAAKEGDNFLPDIELIEV